MRCITVLYANKPGIKFDFDYYLKHHATLIKRLYGKGIAKLELRKGLTAPDGSPPAHTAVISIWIGSQETFDKAQAEHAPKLIADVPNFTNTMPTIQIDEVVE